MSHGRNSRSYGAEKFLSSSQRCKPSHHLSNNKKEGRKKPKGGERKGPGHYCWHKGPACFSNAAFTNQVVLAPQRTADSEEGPGQVGKGRDID